MLRFDGRGIKVKIPYIYGMTKYRKERSFRERKSSYERKVLFQLFGPKYLFLLTQISIFDMIMFKPLKLNV